MIVRKASWHYQLRKGVALLVELQAGREIDIDLHVHPIMYWVEVLFGAFLVYIVFPLAFATLKILDSMGLARPLNNISKKILHCKKREVRFKQ